MGDSSAFIPSIPSELGSKVCGLLGLDPRHVKSIDLSIEVGKVVEVTVRMSVLASVNDPICAELVKFHLVRSP